MEILQTFLLPSAWLALLTLTFLEIVLGIDNIVFLSIMSSKLPLHQQPRARAIGLGLAMLARIALLFGISLLMQLTQPLFHFQTSWIEGAVTGQSLIILAGGLFLLYKSVTEVHDKLEGGQEESGRPGSRSGFWAIILQIVALDIVFSFDSVLTAVGMVSFRDFGYAGAMTIMITAIVIAVALMLFFSGPISRFVNQHPTIQMLALSFLILIGVMLLVEAAHLSQLVVFGREVNEIPKGYIYFAIAFSLGVEVLNMKLSKKSKPVQLHDSRIKRKKT
ncbi:putative tellurium resistance membrane protein TerC [Parabacteroides sp. PFB2-12]|uniref:TerC family protein n=1 Tax=unclassified Parabacteroides TaxID=2649774 RepID=UPI002473E06C|nr:MULTISPECIES: TerC family protein [unclassified Parabacteroides]MDH6343934.1 putative tellurium resistance membrane protein TerC [Parabacteroides sp. PM6-13]MDH6391705.1 putative tellurium resistance membrane protein TerC [Parabacteroides sp. PFB2-12]